MRFLLTTLTLAFLAAGSCVASAGDETDKARETEKSFREAIQRDSGNVTLLCDFAEYFSDRKQYRDAETVLKNAVLIAPDFRRTLYNLGLVIAWQQDRQTEGLRYLKLALGETLAYRELAKICQATGNANQAEYARQRAEILQRTGPATPESLTEVLKRPTIPMDEPTKKELVEHIRRELLRQESREIAVEIEADEKMERASLHKLPVVANESEKKAGNFPSWPTQTIQAIPAPDENIKNEPLSRTPEHVLPSVTTESEVAKSTVAEQRPALPTIPTKPTEAPAKIPVILPKTAEPQTATPKRMTDSVAKDEKPSLPPLPVLVARSTPPQEPPPIGLKPVTPATKTKPQEKKRELVKSLPVPEDRISNSEDVLAFGKPVGDVEPLPILVLPLDDKPRQGNLPEYTAIGMKRIPAEKQATPKSEPTRSTQKKEEAKISHSSAKVEGPPSELPLLPAPVLTQPVDLISMDSRPTITRTPVVEPAVPNRAVLNNAVPNEADAVARFSPQTATSRSVSMQSTELKRLVSDTASNTTGDSSRSILRPGAGKNWDRDTGEDYVYAGVAEMASKADLPTDGTSAKTSEQGFEQDGAQVTLWAMPQTAPVKPIQQPRNRHESAIVTFKIIPAIQPGTEPVTENAVQEWSEPGDTPEVLLSTNPYRNQQERSELRFSSNRTPNVLRFELAQHVDVQELHEAEPEPLKTYDFHPPTILKFAPHQRTVPVEIAEKPEPRLSSNNNIPGQHMPKADVIGTPITFDQRQAEMKHSNESPKDDTVIDSDLIARNQPEIPVPVLTPAPVQSPTLPSVPIPKQETPVAPPMLVAQQKTFEKDAQTVTTRTEAAPMERGDMEKKVAAPVTTEMAAKSMVRPLSTFQPVRSVPEQAMLKQIPEATPIRIVSKPPAVAMEVASNDPEPVIEQFDGPLQELSRQFAVPPAPASFSEKETMTDDTTFNVTEERARPAAKFATIVVEPVVVKSEEIAETAPATPEPEVDGVGFAMTRPSKKRQQLNEMLDPKKTLVDPSTFPSTESDEKQSPKTGFARSGNYSSTNAKKNNKRK